MASLSWRCVVGIRRKVKCRHAEIWILWIRARPCKRLRAANIRKRQCGCYAKPSHPAPPGRTPCKGRAHGAAVVLYRDRERTITQGRGYLVYICHCHIALCRRKAFTDDVSNGEGATRSRFAAFVAFESERKRGSWCVTVGPCMNCAECQ